MANAASRRLLCLVCSFSILWISFFCVPAFPQKKKAKKEDPGKSQSGFSVKVNAVVVHLTVTDKNGNPVTDLAPNEIKVYDDEKLQNIQTFAPESFGPPEPEEENIPSTSPAEAKPAKQTPKEQKNTGPRLISIVIDDLTMESADSANNYFRPGSILEFPRLVDAVKKFVQSDMGPGDQVAVISGSRKVQFPFTDNKQRVLQELETVPGQLNHEWAIRPPDVNLTDLEAWMIAHNQLDPTWAPFAGKDAEWRKAAAQNQSMDVEYRTRNLLYTVRQHLQTLSHFEGSKMLVIFSDGFITEPKTTEAYQMQELVNIALRSGIILNTVSIRSLAVEEDAPSHDVVKIPTEMDRGAQEKPMEQLAKETGGQFFSRSNDLYMGLKTIAHQRASYYTLTYGMPPYKPDGAYHRIKLESTRPGLELSYRKGYYVPTEELTFENSKKEDLLAAINAPGNMNQIPMTLAYNYSQEDDSTYAVSFLTNVNIRGLRFFEEDDRRKNQISLVLAAYDDTDHYISGLEKSMDFQLLESSYSGIRERGLTSRVELKLPVGRYKIKAVVRENAQGKMGSITKSVEIP